MKQNMAPWDRGVRFIIAAVFLFLVFANYVHGVLGWVLGIIGLYLMFTGLFGFCLIYALLKFSSISDSSEE